MALIYLDNDPWITEHDACDRLSRDILSQLALRGKEQRTSNEFTRLSAAIRLRLKQYSVEVEQLKQKLDHATRIKNITAEESERRSRQIEQLQSRDIQMQRQFHDQLTMASKVQRDSLLEQRGPGNAFRDLGTASWGIQDDDELLQGESSTGYRALSTQQLKQTQTEMLTEQERGLENLSKIISRQKNIAETISTEVDLHNEILDDLVDHIERTDDRVTSHTQIIQVIDRKDKTCVYWVVIVLLFITIMIVALV